MGTKRALDPHALDRARLRPANWSIAHDGLIAPVMVTVIEPEDLFGSRVFLVAAISSGEIDA